MVRIDATQSRYDLKAELTEPIIGINNILMRLAYNDYQHVELENTSPEPPIIMKVLKDA